MNRAVAAVVAAALAAAACRRGEQEIRDGFTAAFDAPPVLAIAPCPDADAKLARLRPLFELAMRAHEAVKTFDEPLPADLQADLMATPIEGLASDYRCLLADGMGREVLMGEVANVYMHKGEALLALGKDQATIDAGWAHILQGLAVYSGPRPIAFIMYLAAGRVIRHIRTLIARNPPPPRELDQLESMAASTLLRRADLCAGVKLEFLWQAYLPFHEVLSPLRDRVRARWGDRSADAAAAVAEDDARGDLALWRATADLYEPLVAGCLDPAGPPLAPLEAAARAKLAALPSGSSVARLAPTTLERLHQYGDLEDELLLFFVDLGRRRLQIAGVRYDAAAVEKHVLVPSLPVPRASSWDGSRAAVADDPATPGALIVTRRRARQVLPPLAPLPSPPRR